MNGLDVLVLLMVGASVFYGAKRGLVLEVFALVALTAGLGAGIAYHDPMARLIEGWIDHQGVARFLGFAVVFLAVGAAVFGLGQWVRTFVHAVFLGWVDRVGGGVIGFLKGAFAVWVLVTLGVAYLPLVEQAAENSKLAPMLLEVSEKTQKMLPEGLGDMLEKRLKTLKKIWKEVDKE